MSAMRLIAAGGVRLEVSDRGAGEPVLLIQTALTADELRPLGDRLLQRSAYRTVFVPSPRLRRQRSGTRPRLHPPRRQRLPGAPERARPRPHPPGRTVLQRSCRPPTGRRLPSARPHPDAARTVTGTCPQRPRVPRGERAADRHPPRARRRRRPRGVPDPHHRRQPRCPQLTRSADRAVPTPPAARVAAQGVARRPGAGWPAAPPGRGRYRSGRAGRPRRAGVQPDGSR